MRGPCGSRSIRARTTRSTSYRTARRICDLKRPVECRSAGLLWPRSAAFARRQYSLVDESTGDEALCSTVASHRLLQPPPLQWPLDSCQPSARLRPFREFREGRTSGSSQPFRSADETETRAGRRDPASYPVSGSIDRSSRAPRSSFSCSTELIMSGGRCLSSGPMPPGSRTRAAAPERPASISTRRWSRPRQRNSRRCSSAWSSQAGPSLGTCAGISAGSG
jgi:hypothetical protein